MSSDPSLDPTALERLLEITGGDPDFIDELVDTFLDDAVTQLAALRDAAERGDADALVRPSHSLKSNAANVGAVALASLSRDLEAAGRTGTVPDAAGRVDGLEREFAVVRSGLLASRADRPS